MEFLFELNTRREIPYLQATMYYFVYHNNIITILDCVGTDSDSTEIIAKVETAIRPLDAEQADTVRRTVNNVLQKAVLPKPNITTEMRNALKSLKQDNSIMILPADKGNHSKMSTLIETGPYKLLNKDPTERLSQKATEKLLQLKRSGNLSETEYNKIRPKQKRPPRIYGVPKIHKANAPLRPIVSCVNTVAFDLSGHLARILSPLTGSSSYTVKNSGEFANIISKETIQTDEVMISSNVESLFTNVPIVQAALHRLNNDPSLPVSTALTPTQIADLLNFVLRSIYFKRGCQ